MTKTQSPAEIADGHYMRQAIEGLRFNGAVKCRADKPFATVYGTFHTPSGDVEVLVNRHNEPKMLIEYETPDLKFSGPYEPHCVPDDATSWRMTLRYTRRHWDKSLGGFLLVTIMEWAEQAEAVA